MILRNRCRFVRWRFQQGSPESWVRKRRSIFTLTPRHSSIPNNDGQRVVEPGRIRVELGGKQPGFRGSPDAITTGVLTGQFEVKGRVTQII